MRVCTRGTATTGAWPSHARTAPLWMGGGRPQGPLKRRLNQEQTQKAVASSDGRGRGGLLDRVRGWLLCPCPVSCLPACPCGRLPPLSASVCSPLPMDGPVARWRSCPPCTCGGPGWCRNNTPTAIRSLCPLPTVDLQRLPPRGPGSGSTLLAPRSKPPPRRWGVQACVCVSGHHCSGLNRLNDAPTGRGFSNVGLPLCLPGTDCLTSRHPHTS